MSFSVQDLLVLLASALVLWASKIEESREEKSLVNIFPFNQGNRSKIDNLQDKEFDHSLVHEHKHEHTEDEVHKHEHRHEEHEPTTVEHDYIYEELEYEDKSQVDTHSIDHSDEEKHLHNEHHQDSKPSEKRKRKLPNRKLSPSFLKGQALLRSLKAQAKNQQHHSLLQGRSRVKVLHSRNAGAVFPASTVGKTYIDRHRKLLKNFI